MLHCRVLRVLKDECKISVAEYIVWPQFLICSPLQHPLPCNFAVPTPLTVDGQLSQPLTESIWLPHMTSFWQWDVNRCEATVT